LSLNGDDTEGLQAGDRRVSGKLEIRSLERIQRGALQPLFRRLDFRLEFSSARINALEQAVGLSRSRTSPKISIRNGAKMEIEQPLIPRCRIVD